MDSSIKKLPVDVINKIAAGEVIQRPSSILKELVENSIDSGAKKIDVFITDYGKTEIQVSDDGYGMNLKNLRICFLNHSTSKLNSFDDLFALKSKGFRGEALSSICSISKTKISSCDNNKGIRNFVQVENNDISKQSEEVGARGTTVISRNIFYNVPARRKFLKSDKIEFKHIMNEFIRLSLSHPEIVFTLRNNNQLLYNLKKGNQKKRIVEVLGKSVEKKIIPIQEKTNLVKIRGYIFKPEYLNKSRNNQFLFINNRYVKSSYLNHAISMSYDGLVDKEIKPSYVLFLDSDPSKIDVNVHPSKTEVKFDDENIIYAIIMSTIKHSLGKYNIIPNIDFSNDINLSIHSDMRVSPPLMDIDYNFSPFKTNDTIKSSNSSETSIKNESSSIFNNNDLELINEYPVFDFSNKFLITKSKTDLLVIDIKRAYYRIYYEQFLNEINNKNNLSQRLLYPIEISFSPSDILIIKSVKNILSHLGFIFSVQKNNVNIKSIHPIFDFREVESIFNDIIEKNSLDFEELSPSLNDHIAKLLANSKSKKILKLKNKKEQDLLLNKIFNCKEPNLCPQNKKIIFKLSIEEINSKFN
ncbi:DNA mismatch repair endonuclease MutL [Flavobacteriales bacterium]|nr:DNA mismatch repair endonuclease MutL [Flavobacteriales bacterium]